jgi:streptogramin lyase
MSGAARLLGVSGALSLTVGVCAGPGEILVGNLPGHNVLKFDASKGDFLKTFVQMGQAEATDIAWGPDGDLFLTDVVNAAVLRYDGNTGAYEGQFVKPGAGGLASPQSLVFGPSGNLYVTGTPLTQINEYDGTTGEFVKTVFSAGATVPGQITFGPSDGLIYFACQTCKNVKIIDPVTGQLLKILLKLDGEGKGPGAIRGLAWGPDGKVYVTSAGDNDSIRRYNGVTGDFIDTFAVGGMDDPYDVTFGSDVMYVSSTVSSNVMVFDAVSGAQICEAAAAGVGGLSGASGVLEIPAEPCYADFDGSGDLSFFDFLGYMNSFNAGNERADCDVDGDRDLFDFLCYQNAFVGGCP